MADLLAQAKSGALPPGALAQALGADYARIIATVAAFAQRRGQRIYLVGGIVRDLLLRQANYDLDFVLEADAIAFVQGLAAEFGGAVHSYPPFGTATWLLDGASMPSAPGEKSPQRIDFARARRETYAQAAALPTVAPADIIADMGRRDFSINAIALRLSPPQEACHVVDPCGGIKDLERRQLRILHRQSFVDDPTRIFRAWRFAARLGFEVAAQSSRHLHAALPLIREVSGQRLRRELERIFLEKMPGRALHALQTCGALTQIQPAFSLRAGAIERLNCYRQQLLDGAPIDESLAWCLLLADAGERAASAIGERLAMPKHLLAALGASAKLYAGISLLDAEETDPSAYLPLLDSLPDAALTAGLLLCAGRARAAERLERYRDCWRALRPGITGEQLKARGLPTGPRYKHILEALRYAWVRGDITNTEQEWALLEQLLASEG